MYVYNIYRLKLGIDHEIKTRKNKPIYIIVGHWIHVQSPFFTSDKKKIACNSVEMSGLS